MADLVFNYLTTELVVDFRKGSLTTMLPIGLVGTTVCSKESSGKKQLQDSFHALVTL